MSPRSGLNVQRAAARLAGRELRRRPWRTALVALLVALPVAAMVLAASLLRTGQPPFDVEDRSTFGLADATLAEARQPAAPGPEDPGWAARLAAAAPGARTTVVEEAFGRVQGPSGGPRFVRLIGPEGDPMVAARTTLRTGRLPRAADEVAVAPRLARAWNLQVGSTLDLPQLGLRATVVGIAHPLAGVRAETIHVGAMPDIAPLQRSRRLFVDLPGDATAVSAAVRTLAASGPVDVPERNRAGLAVSDELRAGGSDRDREVRWSTVIGALALAVLGIVIAAAFAVGARRQLRTLGILASNGASPSALRAVVLWQGMWVGLVGAAVGLVLGAGGLAALWPHHDRFLSYEPAWFTVRVTDLVPVVVLGTLTALAAAYQPARSVSRLSILTSLAGRRPLVPVRRRVVLLGLVAMATGTAFLGVATVGAEGTSDQSGQPGDPTLWVGIAIVGGLGLLFGASAVAPGVVGAFDPLSKRLRGGPLLALRSLGRQRARTGAVVAAACATAALAVAGSAVVASAADDSSAYLPPNVVVLQRQVIVDPLPADPQMAPGGTYYGPPGEIRPAAVDEADIAAVAAAVPGARRVEVPMPDGFIVATPEVLDAFAVDAATRRLLAQHGAVRPGRQDRDAAPALFDRRGSKQDPGAPDPDLDAFRALQSTSVPAPASRYGFVNFATALVTPARLAQTGLEPGAPAIALVARQPLSKGQRDALDGITGGGAGSMLRLASDAPPAATAGESGLQVQFLRPQPVPALVVYAVLDGLALVFTGFVIVVGLALAAAETREEVEVLTAVGAAPSTLRRLAGTKAALLAASGVLLALPTGLAPVWVVRQASNGSGRFLVPWAPLGFLVFGLPALLALLAFGASAVLSRLRPVTASTMAAD